MFATSETVTCVLAASPVWKRKVSNCHITVNRTHVEDVEDLGEVQPPGSDRPFIALRVEESRDGVPFPPLDDLPLNLCHSPVIQDMVSELCTRCASASFTYTVNSSIAPRTV